MRWRLSTRLRTALAITAVALVVGAGELAAHVRDPRPDAAVGRPTSAAADLGAADAGAPVGHGWPWAWAVYVGILLALVGTIGYFLISDGLLAGRRDGEDIERAATDEQARRGGDAAALHTREQALADAEAELAAGAPAREVVIACWVRLEEAAAAAGFGRRPAETSTDLARRLLIGHPTGSGPVDRDAVEALAALFREARFSTHPMTDGHRARALAALRRLRLPAVAG